MANREASTQAITQEFISNLSPQKEALLQIVNPDSPLTERPSEFTSDQIASLEWSNDGLDPSFWENRAAVEALAAATILESSLVSDQERSFAHAHDDFDATKKGDDIVETETKNKKEPSRLMQLGAMSAGLLALAACGSGGDKVDTTPSPAETSTSQSAEPTEAPTKGSTTPAETISPSPSDSEPTEVPVEKPALSIDMDPSDLLDAWEDSFSPEDAQLYGKLEGLREEYTSPSELTNAFSINVGEYNIYGEDGKIDPKKAVQLFAILNTQRSMVVNLETLAKEGVDLFTQDLRSFQELGVKYEGSAAAGFMSDSEKVMAATESGERGNTMQGIIYRNMCNLLSLNDVLSLRVAMVPLDVEKVIEDSADPDHIQVVFTSRSTTNVSSTVADGLRQSTGQNPDKWYADNTATTLLDVFIDEDGNIMFDNHMISTK